MTRADVARALGVSKATVSYHARRLGLDVDERCARRYDWEAIQSFHDQGHSRTDCLARFGLSPSTWYDAVKRGDLSRVQLTLRSKSSASRTLTGVDTTSSSACLPPA